MKKLKTNLLSLGIALSLITSVSAQESTLVEKSFTHNGITRDYFVYKPSNYSTASEWPLILNFHGYSGDVPDHINRTKMHGLADSLGYLIAYPVGLTINRDPNILPSFVPATGAGWSVPGFSNERNEIAFTDSLINEISKNYSIDNQRIHAAGLSLGGYMAAYVGTQMPNKIASFASVAGHLTNETLAQLSDDVQVSALLIHGTDDQITNYYGLANEYVSTESIATRLATNNKCATRPTQTALEDVSANDNTTVTLFDFEGCDEGITTLLYRVNGGGHRWPGSGRLETTQVLGNNSLDINSSELILKFFELSKVEEELIYQDLADSIQVILDTRISAYGIEGVTTSFVFPNNEVHTLLSGYANGENDPIDIDKKWHWASGTKPMTGYIVLKLVELGMLGLEDDISEYLDINSIPNLEVGITIKNLLQHTSGLEEIWSESNADLWGAVWGDRGRVWNPDEVLPYMPELRSTPGEHYYASTNSYLLSFIIEAVTGKGLEENFQEYIFEPLGMSSSFLSSGKEIDMTGLNGVWRDTENRSTLSHTSYLSSRSGNSAHISTPTDAVKFYRSYYSNELLSSALMEEVRAPANGSSEVIFENYACVSKVTQLHGYETTIFEVLNTDGKIWNFYGHGGNGVHNSFSYHWEQKDVTVVMAINDFTIDDPFAALIFDVLCKVDEMVEDVPVNNELTISEPVQFSLHQNYPNPFNPSTNISFELPEAGLVQLKVFNLIGQEVAKLLDGRMNSGSHAVNFDASQLSSGIYIYRLVIGNQVITKKMTLIK